MANGGMITNGRVVESPFGKQKRGIWCIGGREDREFTSGLKITKIQGGPHDYPTLSTPTLPRPSETLEELSNWFLQIDENAVSHISFRYEATTLRTTVRNIIKLMMSKSLAMEFTWSGTTDKNRGKKQRFKYSECHEFLKRVLEKTSFAKENESNVGDAVKRVFHNVRDWNGGRASRQHQRRESDDVDSAEKGHQKQESNGVDNVVKGNSEPTENVVSPVSESCTLPARRMKLPDRQGDNYITEEEADSLIKSSKFNEAMELLEDLSPTKRQQMLLLECYFQLNKDSKMLKTIQTMKKLMMRHPRSEAVYVYNFGLTNFEMSCHMKAIVFLASASKIYTLEPNTDQSVRGIKDCSLQCSKVIESMIKEGGRMRVLARDIGMEIMRMILDDLRSVDNVDPSVKSNMEDCCLKDIGDCYYFLSNSQKSVDNCKMGLSS